MKSGFAEYVCVCVCVCADCICIPSIATDSVGVGAVACCYCCLLQQRLSSLIKNKAWFRGNLGSDKIVYARLSTIFHCCKGLKHVPDGEKNIFLQQNTLTHRVHTYFVDY